MLGASLSYQGHLRQAACQLYLKVDNLPDAEAHQRSSLIEDEVLPQECNLTVGMRVAFRVVALLLRHGCTYFGVFRKNSGVFCKKLSSRCH